MTTNEQITNALRGAIPYVEANLARLSDPKARAHCALVRDRVSAALASVKRLKVRDLEMLEALEKCYHVLTEISWPRQFGPQTQRASFQQAHDDATKSARTAIAEARLETLKPVGVSQDARRPLLRRGSDMPVKTRLKCKIPKCKSRVTKPCILCDKPVCHHHSGGWPDDQPICVPCKIERAEADPRKRIGGKKR